MIRTEKPTVMVHTDDLSPDRIDAIVRQYEQKRRDGKQDALRWALRELRYTDSEVEHILAVAGA